jgi:DNA-binding NarL/FixJ family response regulator
MRIVSPIRVTIYTPCERIAQAVEMELAVRTDIDLIGAGATPGGALLLARHSDVLLIQYALPDDLLAQIIAAVRAVTKASVVVIGAPQDAALQEQLYEHGVSGCLGNDRLPQELAEAVRTVARNGLWIKPPVLRSALTRVQELNERYRRRQVS